MSTGKRIAVNTGGGDAPGLNAVIRAIVLAAEARDWEVVGIRRGYEGLLDTDKILPLTRESVRGITHLGGTILGTTNRGDPFNYPVGDQTLDRSGELLENFHRLRLDALIAIGGDGSMRIAKRLADMGLSVVGVPKTIDNDLAGTVVTFGFQTAVGVATEAVDRLHSTAEAHGRVFTIEVMGRYAGWIALHAGIAGGADVILIPEIPFRMECIQRKIEQREAAGRHFSLIVVAEGARPEGGEAVKQAAATRQRAERLGGIGAQLARDIERATGKETRSVVLGHLQRGGWPNAYDRVIALRFGAAAVRVIEQGRSGVMVALDPPTVRTVALEVATERMKSVPLDGDTILTARDMGVCLGDG